MSVTSGLHASAPAPGKPITWRSVSRLVDPSLYQHSAFHLNPELGHCWTKVSLSIAGWVPERQFADAWTAVAKRVPLLRTGVDRGSSGRLRFIVYTDAQPAVMLDSHAGAALQNDTQGASVFGRVPFMAGSRDSMEATVLHFYAPAILVDYTSAASLCRHICDIATGKDVLDEQQELAVDAHMNTAYSFASSVESWDMLLRNEVFPLFTVGMHAAEPRDEVPRTCSIALQDRQRRMLDIGRTVGVSPQVVVEALWAIVATQHSNASRALMFTSSRHTWSQSAAGAMCGFLDTHIPLWVDVNPDERFPVLCARIDRFHAQTAKLGYYDVGTLKSRMARGSDFSVQLDFSSNCELPPGVVLKLVFDWAHGTLHVVSDARMDPDAVAILVDHLDAAFEEACADIQRTSFSLLSAAERASLLDLGAPAAAARPALVHELLEESVQRSPAHTAVAELSGRQCTLVELDALANAVAHGLAAHTHTAIAVLMEPSIELVACLFGILKSANTYVILDPSGSGALNELVVADSGAALVVCSAQYAYMHATCVPFAELVRGARKDALRRPVSPSDTAYYVYTSGTSGKPKGVALAHAAAANGIQCYGAIAGRRALLFYNPIFSAAQRTLLSTVINGGTLCIAPRPLLLTQPARVLREMRINVVGLTATTLSLLPADEEFADLQQIVLTGERVRPELLSEWLRKCVVMNSYGLSENTQMIFSRAVRAADEPATCGRPSDTTAAYVLRADSAELAPRLIIGELCLGGAQLATEYHALPEATQRAFVPSPFGEGRLFRTGDCAVVHADGAIQVLGRTDFQVKIHGQRVELEEVNAVVRGHAGIAAVAVVGAPVRGSTALVAAVVLHASSEVPHEVLHAVRQHTYAQLPLYMCPTYWRIVPDLPRNANGKLNMSALVADARASLAAGSTAQASAAADHPLVAAVAAALDMSASAVDMAASFLDLGGSSLDALRISMRLAEAHLSLPPSVLLRAPSLAEVAGALQTSHTVDAAHAAVPPASVLEHPDAAARFEHLHHVTALQEGILAATWAGSTDYLYQRVYDVSGMDVGRVRAALETAFAASDMARTTFFDVHGTFMQGVDRDAALTWSEVHMPLSDYLRADKKRPVGPSFVRAAVVHGHYFVLSMHHALFDYWSHLFLLDDAARAYYGMPLTARPPFTHYLGALPAVRPEDLAVWSETLAGAERALLAPRADAAPHCVSARVRTKAVEQMHGITMSALVYTIWALVLRQQTNKTNVLFAVVRSGRDKAVPGISMMHGPTLDITPLHVRTGACSTFDELCRAVGDQFWAMAHVAHVGLKRALQASPGALLDTLVNVLPPRSHDPITDSVFRPVPAAGFWYSGMTTLEVQPVQDGTLEVRLISALQHVHADCILRTVTHCLEHVEDLLRTPLESIYVQPYEDATLLQLGRPRAECTKSLLQEHFERHAALEGTRPALQWLSDAPMTYAQVEYESNQIARMLHALGVRPGERVPLITDKSTRAILYMLGILKAGGAFVPLNPSNPAERNIYAINKVQAHFAVVERGHDVGLADITAISMDEDYSAWDGSHVRAPDLTCWDTAYVIFTSGSTGVPKGVQVPHAAAASSITSMLVAEQRSSDWRCLQFASFHFDAAIQDIFNTLSSGGCVCMAPTAMLHAELATCINMMQVSGIIITPTVAKLLEPDEVPSLKTLIVGGEAMTADLVHKWASRVRLLNVYGPTETSMVVTTKHVTPTTDPHNIGQPLNTTGIIVLDLHANRGAPVGSVGELGMFGPQLADGYVGEPDKTAGAFVLVEGTRVYRTGDMVIRSDIDGDLRFLGRKDSQVKLHGHRIELGEIEQAAMHCTPVAECIVLHDTVHGDAQLVLFVRFKDAGADTDALVAALIATLRARVAPYMVPKLIIPRQQFPRLLSQKVDRVRLRTELEHMSKQELKEAALRSSSAHAVIEPPATANEKLLCGIVAELLDLSDTEIGRNTNFVELGGDSITAIKLAGRLRQNKRRITVREILESVDLAQISSLLQYEEVREQRAYPQEAAKACIAEKYGVSPDSIEYVLPCPPGQREFLHQGERPEQLWTLTTQRAVPHAFDIDHWIQVVEELTARNGILRSTFFELPGGAVQAVLKQRTLDIAIKKVADDEQYTRTVDDTRRHRFTPGCPYILYRILELPGGQYEIIVKMNHALYDGQLLRVFNGQFEALWNGKVPQEPGTPFETFALTLWNKDPANALSYWEHVLADKSPSWPQISECTAEHAVSMEIDEQNLRSRASSMQVTVAILFQGAFQRWLAERAGNTDVSFDLLATGRDVEGHADAENINGTCANFMPFRIHLDERSSTSEYLRTTQSLYWKATEASIVGLDDIYRHLGWSRDAMGSRALFLHQHFAPSSAPPSPCCWVRMAGSKVSMRQPYGVVFETSLTLRGYRLKLFFDRRVFSEADALEELGRITTLIMQLA